MRTKSNPHNQGRMRRRRLALALACLLMAPAAWSQTLPDTGTVVSGAATADLGPPGGPMNPGGGGTAMTITQTSPSAIINWETFNVAAGATLTFVQPDAASVTLNRVVGPVSGSITPSLIYGTINGNGNVFLINPTGILFGSGSAVNVGGLVASTLAISDADFLAGAAGVAPHHYVFTPYGGPGAAIVNQGTLTASTGGTIALLAARIENQNGAAISAPDGSVVIGAGSGATLDFYDDGLTTVTLVGNGPDLDPGCSSSPVPTSSCLGGIEIMGDITAAGDITLTADNSTSGGIVVSNNASITGGGDISLSAQGSATGIYLHDSQITSNGGDISLAADGPVHGVRLQNASVTSNSGAITMTASGSQYGVLINYHSAVESGGGDVTITTNGSHDGININNFSTVDSGGGNIAFTADSSVMGVQIVYHAAVDSGGGDITLSGDSATQYGVLVTRYSSVYSHGGAITMHADDSRGGISFWDATIDSEGGDILLTAENAYYNSGVRIRDTSIDGDNISMDADGSSFGVYAKGSTITAAGAVAMHADNGLGILLTDSTITSNGDIALHAGNSVTGVQINYLTHISSGSGDIDIYGTTATAAKGVQVYYSSITSTSGDISITGNGVSWGVDLWYADIETTTGAINASGISSADNGIGVRVLHSDLSTTGGDIALSGTATGNLRSVGVRAWYSDLSSGGGEISVLGDSPFQGISLYHADLASDGGTVQLAGTGGWYGLTVSASNLLSDGGDILLSGSGDDSGVGLQVNTVVSSNGGDIDIVGHGGQSYYNGGLNTLFGGVAIWSDSQVTSAGGDVYVLGTGASTGSFGVFLYGAGTLISSGGGSIELVGDADGTGLLLQAGTSVDGGSGTVGLQAGNDGSSDAIVLAGQISSTTGVALRPFDEANAIYLGGGNGFVVDNIELSHISTPWLVIGSAQHQGAIQVLSDMAFGGNMSLQNQSGTAGIHLAGALDVSGYTLGLLAGGSIDQTSAGIIRAKSLLAIASANVLLATAQNDVTGNTLAGSAGGRFEYLDANDLAIGEVTAISFVVGSNGPAWQTVSGIEAMGNVLVRTMTGNLTLGGDVRGANIDLVAADVFLNPDGYSLSVWPSSPMNPQSGNWRVWANTWVGENRGGLNGSGPMPNVYGCTYSGTCGPLSGNGNQFIYAQQPPDSAVSGRPTDLMAELEEETGSSSNEASVNPAHMCPMTDMVADIAVAGSDPLGNDWLKVRKKLKLVNCFSNDRTGGCGGF